MQSTIQKMLSDVGVMPGAQGDRRAQSKCPQASRDTPVRPRQHREVRVGTASHSFI